MSNSPNFHRRLKDQAEGKFRPQCPGKLRAVLDWQIEQHTKFAHRAIAENHELQKIGSVLNTIEALMQIRGLIEAHTEACQK